MGNAESQVEPRRKTRRSCLVVIAAVTLIAVIISVVFLGVFNMGQTSYGPGPVEIEVIPDKPFYLQGEEVNFMIYVNNPHNWPVAYPYSVSYLIEKDDLEIASLGGGQIDYPVALPTFPPHSKMVYRELLMPWNQKRYVVGKYVQVEPGDYTFTVSLEGPSFDNSGNCTFEIRQHSLP